MDTTLLVRWLCLPAVIASLSLPAALAWACTPEAVIGVDKGTYRPGDTVTVTGRQFDPGSTAPVEVRMGSGAGALVARTTIDRQGAWAASFALPSTTPSGVHILRAEARDTRGQPIVARVPLPVTLGVRSKPRLHAPRGHARLGQQAPGPNHAGVRARGDGRSRTVQAASAVAPPHGSRTSDVAFPTQVANNSPAAATGRAVRAHTPIAPSPSRRTTTDDLWSGFRSGGRAATTGGLTNVPSRAGAPGSELSFGLGLVGLGFVTLFGGFAVGVARRRRALHKAK